jgi:ubiquinone/menaquinone biosynthesis C-methylase UbiE
MAEPLRLTRFHRVFLRAYGWGTHRLYNELALIYDPVSSLVSGGRWDAWRQLALEYVTGSVVLEVGFGTGELLAALHDRGLHVIGIEPSAAMQRVAARKLTRRNIDVPRIRASTAALPFASESFDTVISTFPADYILQPAGLAEIARVLLPGGRLVVAGLTVDLPRSPSRPLSWLPASSDRLWAYLDRVAAEAGLSTTVRWHEDPPARVPVVVAVRVRG